MKLPRNLRFLVCLIASTLTVTLSLARVVAEDSRPRTVALVLDTSGSMAGSKLRHLKEAAKLLIAILDRETLVVQFDDSATGHSFHLRTAADRRDAMGYVDKLKARGGTDYVAALKKVQALPADTPILFVSDGANTRGSDDDVLGLVRKNIRGRLITVGVEAPKGVNHLLAKMAAATGGQHVRVDKAEDLVKALLNCTMGLADYRSHNPQDNELDCRQVRGKALVFAYDAVPEITASPSLSRPPFEYRARLPGEQAAAQTVELAQPTDLHISIRDSRSKLARLAHVLRSDLPQAHMTLNVTNGRVATGDHLKATVRFTDPSGNPLPANDALSAEVQLLDPSQEIIDRAVAMPSQDGTRYEASLQMPRQPGLVTIRGNTTVRTPEGQGFVASEDQTVFVAEAHKLTATPLPLESTTKIGRFQAQLQIHIVDASDVTAAFTAELAAEMPGLRLLGTSSDHHTLTLDFEATRAGSYRGKLLVRANADVLTSTLELPYRFVVHDSLRGLAWLHAREVDLGTALAGSGPLATTVQVPSLDEEPAPYRVELQDVAGQQTFLPCAVDRRVIQPTRDAPAELTLTVDVGNVPAGDYAGRLILSSGQIANVDWDTVLKLRVTEPLTAEPIELGDVEVGSIVNGVLVLQNRGRTNLAEITIEGGQFKAGGAVTHEIGVRFPEIPVAATGGGSREIVLEVAVSPLLKQRGRFIGRLRVRRGEVSAFDVPITLNVVDEGKGPAAFTAAPEKLAMTARPGEVLTFAIRLQATHRLNTPTDLSIKAGTFQSDDPQPFDVTTAFEWPVGQTLRPGQAVTLKGYVVAPKTPATYRGTLQVAGSTTDLKVPLSIKVH